VYTWCEYTSTTIRRWEWRQVSNVKPHPRPDDAVAELPTIEHKFGVMPVTLLELPVGLWAMGRLEDPAIALYRTDNDLDWTLYRAAHALLILIAKWVDDGKPTLGPGFFLRMYRDAQGADDAKFVEPSGVNTELLAKFRTEREADLYRVLHQIALTADASASTAAQSGESKGRDWEPAQALLTTYRDLLVGHLEVVGRKLVAVASPRPLTLDSIEVNVVGLDAYSIADLDELVTRWNLLEDVKAMAPTFRRIGARTLIERFLGDVVKPDELEVILDELEAWEPTAGPLDLFGGADPVRKVLAGKGGAGGDPVPDGNDPEQLTDDTQAAPGRAARRPARRG
jgi:hypothetical protein